MESAKCASELGKIIKYSKNLGNDENLTIFTIIFMAAAFGTKHIHSAL